MAAMKGIDLFAGCGGMSLGFLNAGFDIMLAVDVWQAAGEIYRRNIQNVDFLLQDIRKLDIGTLKKYNPDIIIGGPPCQDFSSAGNRNGNGAHADMTYVFSEVVCKLSPDWFVMENVQEVAKSLVFSEAKELFKENQYGLTEVKLNASYFGVPQNRIRLFLIGKKNEKEGFLTRFIKEEITKKSSSTPLTIREFFGDRIDTQYYYRHPRSYSRRGIFSIDEPSPTIRGVNRPIPKNYKIHTGDACKDLSMDSLWILGDVSSGDFIYGLVRLPPTEKALSFLVP